MACRRQDEIPGRSGAERMTSALLIIDVQQILCSGTNSAHDVDGVINRINLVSRKARAAGTLVVVIQHETKDGDMNYGTDSWTLAPALEVHSKASSALIQLLVAPWRSATPSSLYRTGIPLLTTESCRLLRYRLITTRLSQT